MQLDFFNTVNYAGQTLQEAINSCNVQETRILELMQVGNPVTPFEVFELYRNKHPEIPITSVRRAMTCLTKKDILTKSHKMQQERYGKPNHKWERVA